jgi:hypothetical protein
MASWRTLARIWPGQFRETLADQLVSQSSALQAVHRDTEALRPAEEAVAIYQGLAAERPAKFAPGLAEALDHQSRLLAAGGRQAEALAAIEVAVRLYHNLASLDPGKYLPFLAESLTCTAVWLSEIELGGEALVAAREAVGIYEDRLSWDELPSCAAQAMLAEGRLLCGQARYREAARPLTKGWHVAASQHRQDLLQTAAPALKAAYRADPGGFLTVWRAQTGGGPPDWLTH